MMHFLNMNDDCLEYIMRNLDIESLSNVSDACQRLRRVAGRLFKGHKHYECNIVDENNVKKAINIIRKVGPHLIKLDLTFYDVDNTLYVANGAGQEFLIIVNNSLGENFRELSLSGEIWLIPVLRLAPTFLKLEKLSICADIEGQNGIMFLDLSQLCPNLRTLRIKEYAIIFAPNQNLEVLEFLSFSPNYPVDSFISFIKENKKLQRLYLDNNVDGPDNTDGNTYMDLCVFGENLKILKELRITILFDNLVQGVNVLKGLSQMTTLVLTEYWDDIDDLDEVLHIVKSMKQLKKLWIGNCIDGIPNQQALVLIAVELKQLESFESDLQCDKETITKFIRYGHNLQRFHVELVTGQKLTPRIIEHLATVRKCVAGNRPPLSVYFYPNMSRGVIKAFKEPEIERFLTLEYSESVCYSAFHEIHVNLKNCRREQEKFFSA